MGESDALVTSFPDVRRRTEHGFYRWLCRGRLVARQLDGFTVVIRVPFDVRDALIQQAPKVFSVPPRFTKHMMVVAALSADDADHVERAAASAWRLQHPTSQGR